MLVPRTRQKEKEESWNQIATGSPAMIDSQLAVDSFGKARWKIIEGSLAADMFFWDRNKLC
jgi:hypothetical protein